MTSKISKVKAIHNQLEVCSMMRSGHHAVLYWLFAQINHPIYFRNDVLCYRDERSLKDRGVVIGGKNISSILKTYIYNVEDIPINNIKSIRKKYKSILEIVPPKKSRSLLIIRDPFNMFSSRYRLFLRINKIREEEGERPLPDSRNTNGNSGVAWIDEGAVELWKMYAKEYLGHTNYLGDDLLKINYNKWFSNISYRKKISQNMNLKFSDKNLNYVPVNGHGSSFDVRTMNGRAQKMDVMNRWQRFAENDKFRKIFSDKELIDLSSEIYPKMTKKVIKEMRL